MPGSAEPRIMRQRNQKVKIVSLRMSLEEYSRLRDACDAQVSHSVSELTRDALNAYIRSTSKCRPVEERLSDLQHRLRALTTELDEMADLISKSRPSGAR